MGNPLYTYSLITTLYDNDRDFADCFWPFVLTVLPEDKSGLPIETVQYGIQEMHSLSIPQHTLTAIATRAKRKGLIVQEQRKYRLTDKGVTEQDSLESGSEVSRRINELVEDARQFLQRRYGYTLEPDQVQALILSMVARHVEYLEQFLHYKQATPILRPPQSSDLQKYDDELLEYVLTVEREKPGVFQTFRDIVQGSVISLAIHQDFFADGVRRFEPLSIFFDANFLFCVLELDYPEHNVPALELLKLLRGVRAFRLRVFDFTLDEMRQKLRSFANDRSFYVQGIRVSSISACMRSKGWTASKVRRLSASLEQRLAEHGIEVHMTGLDLEKYDVDADRRTALAGFKSEQGPLGQSHDLAAIECVSKLRGRAARQLERCGAIFVTSDYKLAKFNFIEDRHRDRETVGEVIADRMLTNLLWLRNPTVGTNIPIHSIIAMHSRHTFIDRRVWAQFCRTVEDLRREQAITYEDVATLLYDRHIQDVLREFDPSQAGRVRAEFVLQSIEQAKERLSSERDSERQRLQQDFLVVQAQGEEERQQTLAVQEQVREIERSLEEQRKLTDALVKDAEETRLASFLDSLNNQRKQARAEAVRIAAWIMHGLSAAALLTVAFGAWRVFPLWMRMWSLIEPATAFVLYLIPIVLLILGYKFDAFHLRGRLRDRLEDAIYRRKTRVLAALEADLKVENDHASDTEVRP